MALEHLSTWAPWHPITASPHPLILNPHPVLCFCPSNTTYGRKPAAEDAPPGGIPVRPTVLAGCLGLPLWPECRQWHLRRPTPAGPNDGRCIECG